MVSRAELYERHAKDCLLDACQTDDPRHREILLKMARQWRQEAQLSPGDSRHPNAQSP